MKKYEGICGKFCMKEYVKNMKEYEEICQYIRFGTLISIWALGLEKIPNSPSLYGPWDLEKFHVRTSSWALGLRNISSSAFI